MGLDLRLPNITASTEREQLSQIKSYLYQLASQLQWALNTVDPSSSSTKVVTQAPRNAIAKAKEDDIEVTFDSLKPLIIKSAEIVDAYYEEINQRLSGVYVAESEFGTFTEQTNQSISQTSTAIQQNFENIQSIQTDIENLNFALAESNAYLRSGLLDNEGGIPVYGLEVGQRNTVDGEEVFNKFARFTSDRLSFYDQNDTEVAYVSDYKLFIRNVEVTSSYKIGGFQDIVSEDGGIVTKWVGGNG